MSHNHDAIPDSSHRKVTGLLSSAAWSIFALAVAAVAGFVVAPIVLRGIGTENYGVYSIIMMIGGFAALQDLGLGEATLKYVSQYYARNDLEGVNRVLGATLFVYCLTGFIGFIIVELLAPQIVGAFKMAPKNVPVAVIALRIAGISFLLSTICGALDKLPAATQRYDVSSKVQICVGLVRYGSMIVVVKCGAGIAGLTGLLAGTAVVNIVVYSILARRLIPGVRCWPHACKDGLKEVFGFGIFSFVNQLIQSVSSSVDQLVLGMCFGAKDVGYLTAPKDLLTRVQGVSGAAGYALFPRFSAMTEGPEMERLYRSSLWALTTFSTILFIPAAIVVPVFLSLWVSPEFAEHSSTVARLLALGMAFNGGTSAYFALLKGTGRIRWVTSIVITLTVLSAIVAAMLVYRLGIVGSGIRMIVFAWCGVTICLVVGKKVFPAFTFAMTLVESALIPLATGMVVFFIGCWLSNTLTIKTWWGIIALAGAATVLLVLSAVGVNYAVFGREGSAFAVMNKGFADEHVSILMRKIGGTKRQW